MFPQTALVFPSVAALSSNGGGGGAAAEFIELSKDESRVVRWSVGPSRRLDGYELLPSSRMGERTSEKIDNLIHWG